MKCLSLLILLTFLNSAVLAYETVYKWTGPEDSLCTAIAPDGKTDKVDKKECLLKAPIKYAWKDKKKTECVALTPNNIIVAKTETANCEVNPKTDCYQENEVISKNLRTLVDGTLYKIIPEILSLKSLEEIPKQIIKDKDSRVVAASIVARLKHVDAKKDPAIKDGKFQYDFYKDSEIQMAFNDKNFDKIRNGCFRNQFQTNSSNGTNDREVREQTEKTLVDVVIDGTKESLEDPSDPSHHIRPKYAFFVPTKPMESIEGHRYFSSYGNIYAVMKEEVKERSTFTTMDSLGTKNKAKVLNINNYKEIGKFRAGYWETQVWGSVCFSDVSHFIINCSNNAKVPDETLDKMKTTGIPVYECDEKKMGDNQVYAKGKQLVSENLKLRKEDESKAQPKANFPEKKKIVNMSQYFREKMEEYKKSPEGIAEAKKNAERLEKHKAYMASPEGIAATKKAAEAMEEYYKTPEGLKMKAAMDESRKKIEEYWKSPEGIAAKAKHEEEIKKGGHPFSLGMSMGGIGVYPGMEDMVPGAGIGIGYGVDCVECGVPSDVSKSTEKLPDL